VTALGAACGQHQTAILGRHARTEPVAALANQVRGLKRALHRGSPSDAQTPADDPTGFEGLQLEARPLRAVLAQVNAGNAFSCKKSPHLSPDVAGDMFQNPDFPGELINAA
jgi:hypothetical protein